MFNRNKKCQIYDVVVGNLNNYFMNNRDDY